MENKKCSKKNVTMELSERERELLLENNYMLCDDMIQKLSTVKIRNGFCRITISYVDLDEIVGHVCFLANHEEDSDTWQELNDLADHLEAHL